MEVSMNVIPDVNASHKLNNKKKNFVKRLRKPCPVKKCQAEVIHLPRHLRMIHGWNDEKAPAAIQTFNLRKQYYSRKNTSTGNKKSDSHHPRRCPVTGCYAIVKRLVPHLQNVHYLDRDSELFCAYLKLARSRALLTKRNMSVVVKGHQTSSSSVSSSESLVVCNYSHIGLQISRFNCTQTDTKPKRQFG